MQPVPPITEDDIAQFLLNTPDFFERHAEVLAHVQLTSPHSQRAVSLQERQAELLREKIRHLELKAADMIRHGSENARIEGLLHHWTRRLLAVPNAPDLPEALQNGLLADFALPQVALRLWDLSPTHAGAPYCLGVTPAARALADSLQQPYCGPNRDFEVTQWLLPTQAAASLALLPLRTAASQPCFGLLLLASDDPLRFQNDMGTDFLQRIAELAAAALSRLRAPIGTA
ncbi:MAG: DUF484 family protein [Betaproteobacteria bacterium]|nr:DUF484 family protein [Betaproteobacteria bacterium]